MSTTVPTEHGRSEAASVLLGAMGLERIVRIGWRSVADADLAGLHAPEAASAARAVAARRVEHASGRALLRALTATDAPILRWPNGAPVAPDGWVCSLAHDADLAVAAVAPAGAVRALGIDLERRRAVDGDLAHVVLRDDEQGLDATLAFVAKESAYKAWSVLGGRVLDHHDVRVAVAGNRFVAEVVDAGVSFDGAVVAVEGRWLATAVARP
jgi:4'-phosphopantetheinyl transferase EntD